MLAIPKTRLILSILTCLIGIIFCMPTFLPTSVMDSLPKWLSEKTLKLGLDLRGGSYLLLEIDLKGALSDKFNALSEDIRRDLRSNQIGYSNFKVQSNNESVAVQFSLRDKNEASRLSGVFSKVDPGLTYELNGDQVTVTFTEHALKQFHSSVVDHSINIVNRRVDQMGTTEPEITRQGDDRIVVQLPGVQDPERVKNLINKTAKLTFRIVEGVVADQESVKGRVPPGCILLPATDKNQAGQPTHYYIIREKVLLTGESLIDARVELDHQSSQPVVLFKMDRTGARKFADITRNNVGNRLGMVLDNQIISAPNIQNPIEGGSGQITGDFTVQSANDLALLMRAGALPASLKVLEEKTVGPSLGADSIKAGGVATFVSIALVCAFMMMAYFLFGIFANICVLVNILLLVAGMALLQVTLTLPGIAGIALTVGMAVDANVLINERIKEEIKRGKRLNAAIDSGYDLASATIVDSNLTTVIGAALLFWFGSGPIKGFAVTLIMGILISMFTAVTLSRLMVAAWFNWRRPKHLPI